MSELAKALAEFQTDIPHVGKDNTADAGNYSYQYADLTTITEKAMPLLSKLGLSFVCCPTMNDHGFVLDYSLTHVSGESTGGQYPLPDPSRASSQQIGSAISYARRYCLTAVTGIAPGGEDDDGAKAADARAVRPAQERLQEGAFLDDIRTRVDLSTTVLELDGIETEAKRAFNTNRISGDVAREAKQLVDNRRAELTAPVGAP